jgi:8-oxo-dGTP diphosphatase
VPVIDVVAVMLENQKNEILIAKRKPWKSQGGLWEFPGGKIEKGETPEESLVRELKEEMNIEIQVGDYFAENVHHYENISIRLMAYRGRIISGDFHLKDHDEIAWVTLSQLNTFKFAPADVPFVERLINM